MGRLWFTSDTHFGSKRTLELSKRPFSSVNEMDNAMVEKWNSVVGKDDTILHIGDFGEYEAAKRLNGNIILVFGNYEKKEYRQNSELLLRRLYNSGITIGSMDDYEFKMGELSVGATHKPTKAKLLSYRYDFTIFGHIHKLQMVKEFGLNVGVDCHDFTPIDAEVILFYKNAISNHYDEDVFVR